MKDIFSRFEAWLDKYANALLDDLNEGAEESAFEPIEKKMGVEVPEDFKEFYMIHDGQFSESEDRLFGVEELLSIERMLQEHKKWKDKFDDGKFDDLESEPDDSIRSEWWNPFWLPITSDGNGNHYCIDFAPTRHGQLGQIIRMLHDSPKRKLVAKSFREWMEQYVTELEKGVYIYSEKWGGMIARSRSEHFKPAEMEEEEDMWGNDDDDEEMEGFEILDETDFPSE